MLYMVSGMYQTIKKIREYVNLSQEAFAKELGVNFATVNRWENNRTVADSAAEAKLYTFCKKNDVPLVSFIQEQVEAESRINPLEKGHVRCFHGSKAGLVGPIAPISRAQCDFGPGFYMGDEPLQPLTLVIDKPESKYYVIDVDMKHINFLVLYPNLDWAMTVAYYRGKLDQIKGTKLYDKYACLSAGKDMVIGSIADDRMFFVMQEFFNNRITDIALVESMRGLKLGLQYVCINQHACNCVCIDHEIELSGLERRALLDYATTQQKFGTKIVDDICMKYNREGKYFAEILKEADND